MTRSEAIVRSPRATRRHGASESAIGPITCRVVSNVHPCRNIQPGTLAAATGVIMLCSLRAGNILPGSDSGSQWQAAGKCPKLAAPAASRQSACTRSVVLSCNIDSQPLLATRNRHPRLALDLTHDSRHIRRCRAFEAFAQAQVHRNLHHHKEERHQQRLQAARGERKAEKPKRKPMLEVSALARVQYQRFARAACEALEPRSVP